MGALTFIDAPARYERRGDNAVMILTSNGVEHEFIMSLATLTAGTYAGMRSIADWQATQQANVVAMRKPALGKRRKQA